MSEIKYCENFPTILDGHVAIFEGCEIKNWSIFLKNAWEKLNLPDESHMNWDAYLDWMRDLEWIEEKNVYIIVKEFEKFLCEEPKNKEYFISDFEKTIFPYWKNEAIEVLEDKDKVKNITVICLQEKAANMEITTTEEVVDLLDETILEGRKTPHSVSCPVLRKVDGKLYLAVFVFFYNKEQLQSAMIERPGMWVLADVTTGEIVKRFECKECDFSVAPYDKLYDVSANDIADISDDYWEHAYSLLDRVRRKYVSSGELDMSIYDQYLLKIFDTTPSEYKVFYKDLSDVGTKEDFVVETEMEKNVAQSDENEQAQEEVCECPEMNKEILEKLDAVQQALSELQQTFDDKIAEDTHKNGLFDNMHRELTRYQNGLMDKIVETMAMDIIQLVDSTKGHIRVYEKKEPTEDNYKRLFRVIKGIAEDLEDILYRQSIESYNVAGREVDVKRQRIIQTIPTDDKRKDNLVAVRAAEGYEKDGKIIRPERIKIYKYEPNANEGENK